MRTPATPGRQPTLAGLPQFTRYLSTFPPSQRLLEALFRGPLAHLDARITQLYQLREGDLVSLAYIGPPDSVGDRYTVLPLSIDMPMTRALKSRRISPVTIEEFVAEQMMLMDDDVWDGLVDAFGIRTIVNVPIVHSGTIVGALGFAMARPWRNDGMDLLTVEGIAGPLALWMTHPSAELAEAPQAAREWSLALTARQRVVLAQIRDGVGTPVIARHLGVSDSAIKQDLLRAMKALRTTDRTRAVERAAGLGLL